MFDYAGVLGKMAQPNPLWKKSLNYPRILRRGAAELIVYRINGLALERYNGLGKRFTSQTI